MAIEFVDLPSYKMGGFSHQFFVCLPEGIGELTKSLSFSPAQHGRNSGELSGWKPSQGMARFDHF
jgi:hypothetical protein